MSGTITRRRDGPVNWFDRVFYWCHDHRLSAIEVLNVLVLLWWAVVLMTVPTSVMDNAPIYIGMVRLFPVEMWITIGLGIGALKVFGIVFLRFRMLVVSAGLAGAWWAALGAIFIIETHTYLTPSVYFIVTAASLFRIAELTYHEERRQGVTADG